MRQILSQRWPWLVFVTAVVLLAQAMYMPLKAIAAQILLEHAWQQTLDSGVQHRPWPWADTTTLAKIEFPKHNRQYVVLSGSTGPSLAFGPGHLDGSRLPTESGHMVISGHRDTHFALLEYVKIGETIHIHTERGDIKTYQVVSSVVVDSDKQQLNLEHDEQLLTLVTCYPFNALHTGGPLRLRIDAQLTQTHNYTQYLQRPGAALEI